MAAADPARRPSRLLSWGGLLTALILVFLVAAAFSPTANLALYALTSLCVAIAVIELGQGRALLVYFSAALIGLAYPGLQQSWPFMLFFGLYPLLRALLDGRLSRPAAWLSRLLAGLVLALGSGALFLWPSARALAERLGSWVWPALPLAAALILFMYDYALTLLIQIYIRRIRNRI